MHFAGAIPHLSGDFMVATVCARDEGGASHLESNIVVTLKRFQHSDAPPFCSRECQGSYTKAKDCKDVHQGARATCKRDT